MFFFFQAEDGIRDLVRSRGLGDVYKRQLYDKLFEDDNFIPTLNSAVTTEDGSAIICTDSYLIQISNTFLIKRIIPNTVIHSVRSNSEERGSLVHEFESDENTIDIIYSGIWFNDPSKISFRYQLKNYESKWNTTLNKHVFYTNLPPGDFHFNIETISGTGGSLQNPIDYSFSIAKPYHATWWFRSIVVLLVITGLYFMFFSMERNRKRKQKLERDKLEAQINILKSQINPHFLFNSFNTLITIIEENPRVAVEYVEHLSDFYRNIIVYRERDFISLQEEMELVNSFSFLLQKRYEKGFRLVSSLNGKVGQVMPLALQMLVENAVKHGVEPSETPAHIRISLHRHGKNYATLTVTNTPAGPSAPGLGMALAKVPPPPRGGNCGVAPLVDALRKERNLTCPNLT